MQSDTKWCGRCKENLPTSHFAKNKVKKDGLQERCRKCRSKHYKSTGYVEVSRDNRIKRKYGIRLKDYETMFVEQGGACKICKANDVDLVIDHCHESGVVRGLLCNNCNWGLGNFKDNVDFLQAAKEYLINE